MFSKSSSYFPNLKKKVNTFHDIEIKDFILEESKDKLQGLFENFSQRFQNLMPYFTFLVKQLMVDMINEGHQILKPLVTESSAVQMELTELQEHQCLK